MKIELSDDLKVKIDKLVEQKKYKDFNEFIKRAAETLIMAEEQAKLFNLSSFTKKD